MMCISPLLSLEKTGSEVVMITFHIDDLPNAGSPIAEVESLNSQMVEQFKIRGCGDARALFGMMQCIA